MLPRKKTNESRFRYRSGTVHVVEGMFSLDVGCVSHGMISHYYLCWYRQARGAPCTPLCCRMARTFSSHRCPSAAFPACPQTASCLLRGRRLPGWEGERRVMCGNVSEIKDRGRKRCICEKGNASESVRGGVERVEVGGEAPCHCTCTNNRK